MTHPLRQEIEALLRQHGTDWRIDECATGILIILEDEKAKARKEAVEEIGDKLELVVDSYDGKYYWGLTQDAYDELFTPTPK